MCGIFGYCAMIWQPELMPFFYAQGLYLQHRGYENCGFAFSNGRFVEDVLKGEGKVSAVFSKERRASFSLFQPLIALGHTRYATAGSVRPRCAQPHWAEWKGCRYALASNGDLPLLNQERIFLEEQGISIVSSNDDDGSCVMPNDGEIILRKILYFADHEGIDLESAIKRMMETTEGAYSAALMAKDKLYLFRDPYGFRPLVFGKWRDVNVFASETCAFHDREAKVEREVRPGELVIFDINGNVQAKQLVPPKKPLQHCSFEGFYFSKPDSMFLGTGEDEYYAVRYKLGRQLAKEAPVQDAYVVGIPKSGIPGSRGYARESGNKHKDLFLADEEAGRTFITAGEENRRQKARLKYSVMPSLLKSRINKLKKGVIKKARFVIVDDSIVRLVTFSELVIMLKELWVKLGGRLEDLEIHIRIPSPPIKGPCYYGIDTPIYGELIAANKSVEEIRDLLGVSSLYYLSIEGMVDVFRKFAEPLGNDGQFCLACFRDEYPTPVERRKR